MRRLASIVNDMLILTIIKTEIILAIQGLDHLSEEWNMKLKKTKSKELPKNPSATIIAEVPCVK